MTRDPATAPAHLTLDRFLDEHVLRARHSAFPLTADGGRPAGLVTLNRMKQVRREDWPRTAVASVAVPAEAVPTALPDEPLTELLPRLAGAESGRALVVDHIGRIIGIVTPTDIARTLELSEFGPPLARSRM